MKLIKLTLIAGISVAFVPIVVNYVCNTFFDFKTTDSSCGTSALWVTFFGSYLGGVITAAISMFIFYRTLKKDQKEKEYEIENHNYEVFCQHISRLASSFEIDRLTYALLSLSTSEDKEMSNFISELSIIETNIKENYNSLMLIYGNDVSSSKDKFANLYCSIYEKMQFDKMFDELALYKSSKRRSAFFNIKAKARLRLSLSKIASDIESLGDIPSLIFNAIQPWKKEKYDLKEALHNKYTNYDIL